MKLADLRGHAANKTRRARWLVNLDFAAHLPPWTKLRDDHTVAGQVRREAAHVARVSAASPLGRAALAVQALYWPVRATWDATAGVVTHGRQVAAVSGRSRAAQWRDSMRLAHTFNYSPRTYYLYRFWDPAVRPKATSFLQENAMVVMALFLNRRTATDVLADKEDFSALCRDAGIATPSIVASLHGPGDEHWTADVGRLPHADVFVKPARGMQGEGGERWVHDAVADTWSRRGIVLGHDALLEHCRVRADEAPMVVQPCLSNHPDIARFSTGPLCTFRVMTYRDHDGTPKLLALSLKMARTGSDVDNLHAGGTVCAVDPETGRLGAGMTYTATHTPHREHPDTHEVIEGALLTTHRDVIDLALAAHARLDVPWSVGWDVAMTPDGPMIVEGNPLWSTDLFHVPHGVGLTDDFAASLLEQVRAELAVGASAR